MDLNARIHIFFISTPQYPQLDVAMFWGVFLMLPCWGIAWSVNLELDTALRSDSHWQESRNQGTYLRDSFRSQVLIPAFQSVIHGIRQNAEADQTFRITIVAVLLPLAITLTYILFLLKCKRKARVVLPLGQQKELETKEFKVKLEK